MVEAVIFDLDGVLVESEHLWDEARRELVRERGGAWTDEATRAMMGMSSVEWSRYLREELGVKMPPEEISVAVVERLEQMYREKLPLIPGAAEAVRALGEHWRLALASSANRQIIDLALELAGLAPHFEATVSSEEVPRGKPAPDVYLETARRLAVAPRLCAAIEDSTNGIRSAAAAKMRVVAIPNRAFPPAGDALRLAAVVLRSLEELRPPVIDALEGGLAPQVPDPSS